MKIALLHHYDDTTSKEPWNTPLGIMWSFERNGHEVHRYGFDPKNVNFSKLIGDHLKSPFDFIFVMYAGPSDSLDIALSSLRHIAKCKIVLELGDEPQTFLNNQKRILHADICLTPDYRCATHYQNHGINAVWFNHWCDTAIFHKLDVPRQHKVITTCNNTRPFVSELLQHFGDKFESKNVWYEENTAFFNSGTICFQYARYGEITRRIFEAGGCELAVVTNRINDHTGIDTLFTHDIDIVYYDDLNDCKNQISKLLADRDKTEYLAKNIYKKISDFHTVDIRTRKIIELVGTL